MASAKLNALSDDLATATPMDDDGWCRPTDSRRPPLQRFDGLAGALRAMPATGTVPATGHSTSDAPESAWDPDLIELIILDPEPTS